MTDPTEDTAFWAILVAAAAFCIFLAIFIPLLLIDIHHAPNDGMDGLGGFILAVPTSAVAGPCVGIYYFRSSRLRERLTLLRYKVLDAIKAFG